MRSYLYLIKMNNKNKWTLGFLGVTGLAIAMEIFAAFDGNADTQPWTILITQNIPSWITYTFFSGLFIWLIFHFKKWYRKIYKAK